MKHVTDMDVNKITVALDMSTRGKIVSTRIRCARNLSFLPLNVLGTKQTRVEVLDLMDRVFATLTGDLAGKL